MTKKIVLSAIAASVMASSAFATNGATMLSYGAKDKAMGGTGIASANGAQSAIMNPAMIAGAEEEVSANLTYMIIDVTASSSTAAAAGESSKTDTSMVPTIAYVKPINKELTLGLNVYGAAGMGTEYSSSLATMTTELAILKVAVPVAYKINDNLALGITPVYASGSLAINHGWLSAGVENTDTAFSYELGAAYNVNKELTAGFVYKAPISLEYAGVISAAATPFGLTIADALEQPAEMGLGVTYKMGDSTINFDYKTIAWSSAAGYSDFEWEDQSIIGLGYEYNGGAWTARAGYSSSNSPVEKSTTASKADALNMLNSLGFPALIASHMTFGGSYDVSKKVTVEAAVVLAAGEELSFTDSSFGFGNVTATNDQTNVTIGANYKF